MPLDPSISLQYRPPQVAGFDPIQTLVTVAQLRNMQSQEQLRNLQMADISSKLQTYQAMQDPNSPLAQLAQLRAGGGGGGPAPGMVQGNQLGAATMPGAMQGPMPGAMPAGMQGPPQSLMQAPPGGVPPAPPGQSYVRPAPPTWRPGAQDAATMTYEQARGYGFTPNQIGTPGQDQRPRGIAEGMQGPPVPAEVTAQQLQDQMQEDPMKRPRGVVSAPQGAQAGPVAPQAPQAQAPAPGQGQPGGAQQLPTTPGGDDSARLADLYRQMKAKYRPDIIDPVIESYMNIDKHLLDQQKGKLEFQKAGLNVIEQAMSTVLEQADPATAFAQVRQMMIDRGIPGASQMPQQFNPQWVQTMATNARTAKERIDQQLAAQKLLVENYDAATRRIAEEREGRKITVEKLQGGNVLQQVYPQPGQTGTVAQPGPTGGTALSTEAQANLINQAKLGEAQPVLDAKGNIIPFAKTPGAVTGPLGGPNPAGVATPLTEPSGKPYVSQEAVKLQADIEQTGRARWEEIQKPFQSISRAYNQILASSTPEAAKHQNTADLSLLKAFAHLNNPESVRLNSEMTPEQLGGLGERAKEIWQKVVVGGGVLSDDQRRAVIAQSTILYKTAEGHMHDQMANIREMYGNYGPRVRPDVVAPDITANQPGQKTAAPSGPRVVTGPMLDEMTTRLAPKDATPAQLQQFREQLRQRLRLAGKQVQ
jgi:hypothetical protein